MAKQEIILQKQDIGDFLCSLPKEGPYGKEIAANENRTIIVSQSVTATDISPRAEIHENYTDIFLIKEGKEELYIGGEITDKQLTEPGEWRGKTLEGAKKYLVEVGDVVIIPKGVAHRHGDGLIKLVVVKVA